MSRQEMEYENYTLVHDSGEREVSIYSDTELLETFSTEDLEFFRFSLMHKRCNSLRLVTRPSYVRGRSGLIYPLFGITHSEVTSEIRRGPISDVEISQISALYRSISCEISGEEVLALYEKTEDENHYTPESDFIDFKVDVRKKRPTLLDLIEGSYESTGGGSAVLFAFCKRRVYKREALLEMRKKHKVKDSALSVFAARGYVTIGGKTSYMSCFPYVFDPNEPTVRSFPAVYRVNSWVENMFNGNPNDETPDAILFARNLVRSVVAVKEVEK